MSTSVRSLLRRARSLRMMIKKSESTVRSCTCSGISDSETITTILIVRLSDYVYASDTDTEYDADSDTDTDSDNDADSDNDSDID